MSLLSRFFASNSVDRLERLSSWREGDEGIVVEVDAVTRFGTRLQELGALPEARIRVLRAGCPTLVQIEDGRFCVRRVDADAIRVEKRVPGKSPG